MPPSKIVALARKLTTQFTACVFLSASSVDVRHPVSSGGFHSYFSINPYKVIVAIPSLKSINVYNYLKLAKLFKFENIKT